VGAASAACCCCCSSQAGPLVQGLMGCNKQSVPGRQGGKGGGKE
jgi:hypothetical protein